MLARLTDADTGESTLDIVDSYTGLLSLQMALIYNPSEYISILLSREDEDRFFEILLERRIARHRN
jgi:hypothetical protein